MQPTDIDGVVQVAAACFPDHFENRACFEERLALYPGGCFVLGRGDAVKGYLIAYPWPFGAIPPLNTLLGALPDARDAFYLHDLALHPEARGGGHARPALERLAAALREAGATRIALVSVNDSLAFWQGMGFAPVAADDVLSAKLASYGEGARYMVRVL
ncbi:GNAT family N-acetyltransferase [Novosphingobium gossypii]|uniref:GNAT family N-acetyltransferase n=1 Tax=Novosphingobium gossypii TaxID=1604774 RepID=UPI003D1D552B